VQKDSDLDDLKFLKNATDAPMLAYWIPFEIDAEQSLFVAGADAVLTPPVESAQIFDVVRRLHHGR
jgi:hypothetical protein